MPDNLPGAPIPAPAPAGDLRRPPDARSEATPFGLRFHWVVIGGAIIAPLYVSGYLLNHIVPCAFFDQAGIQGAATSTTAWKNGQCSLTLRPEVYRQLYEFGALTTISVVLAAIAVFFGIRYIIGAFSSKRSGFGPKEQTRRWLAIAAAVILIYFAQRTGILNPHSCISGKLIDLSAGGIPEDDACAANLPGVPAIGSLSSSLKDVFRLIYPLVLTAAALMIIATGYVLGRMIAALKLKETVAGETLDRFKKYNEEAATSATKDVTFLLTLLSGLFTFAIAMTNSYYGVGEKVLVADKAKVEAYQSLERAVALHWGGAGSATIALVFIAEVLVIAYWRERTMLPAFADYSKIGSLIFNVLLVGLPTLVAQTQLAVKF